MQLDPEGIALWESLGRPAIPAVQVDGKVRSILHPTQLSLLLDLPRPSVGDPADTVWQVVELLAQWRDDLAVLDDGLLDTPSPTRPLTVRELLTRVFIAVEQTLPALRTGVYDVESPEANAEAERRAASIVTTDAFAAWAGELGDAWAALGLDDPGTRSVDTSRGALDVAALLDLQRGQLEFRLAQLRGLVGRPASS